jgi:hypothetical protein
VNKHVALRTENAARIGSTNVTLHAMYGNGCSSLAIRFGDDGASGLDMAFHGTTEEIRAFAAELIRHADIADAAMKEIV